jgi:hypothetical protein
MAHKVDRKLTAGVGTVMNSSSGCTSTVPGSVQLYNTYIYVYIYVCAFFASVDSVDSNIYWRSVTVVQYCTTVELGLLAGVRQGGECDTSVSADGSNRHECIYIRLRGGRTE